MKITGKEPINPIPLGSDGICLIDRIDEREAQGLTIRQHFAAMAMQGYLASFTGEVMSEPEMMAERAVKYADALIEELNKSEK